MYSETVEPKSNKKKMAVRVIVVFLLAAIALAVVNHFRFYNGIFSLVILLLSTIGLFGEYRRTFIKYTYVFHEGTLYIDRRVGSVDTILEQLTKEEILSLEVAESIPQKEKRNYCGEGKTPVYVLTYSKGSFYFTPGTGLLNRLAE